MTYKRTFIDDNQPSELDNFQTSNLEIYKTKSKRYQTLFRRIFAVCLNEIPREEIIKLLKSKKIIKSELNEKTNKFELKEKK